jgi:hypothetical protein
LLERAVKEQARTLDKLSKMPRWPATMFEAPSKPMIGIDTEGFPVELRIKKPPGRPKGRKDSRPRRRPHGDYEDRENHLIDPGWEDLKGIG